MTSFASPWFFGPYGQQLRMLTEKLSEEVEVYYLYLNDKIPRGVISFDKVIKIDNEKNSVDIDKEFWRKVKFLGGITLIDGSILVSNLNEIFVKNGIDCMIMCMDLNKILFDESFSIKSVIWYPNHFSPINKLNKEALSNFSHIASLCPTDTELLTRTLPEKRVKYIPHIMELEREKRNKNEIRRKYEIKDDKFVILINCGNYDYQNRKSLDTSIFACEEFMRDKENVILFIHSYDKKSLVPEMSHLDIPGSLRIDDLLEYTDIKKSQVILHNKIVPYDDVLDMMEMSDVLLQGSKSEGFGVPVLESQLLGTPVITTKFGAMGDYTFNGISVPYVQKCYDNLGGGIWVTTSSIKLDISL